MALEIVGYVGSFLIGLSLTMSNIKKLRWINLFGASTFATYGVLIKAWPVLCLNGFIVLTDIYHLIRLTRKSELFSVVPLDARPTPYLKHFVSFNQEDIAAHFPEFALPTEGIEGAWLLRDMQAAGLFIYRQEGERAAVDIDYVAPAYRDMRTANWFFGEGLEHLRQRGIKTLEARSSVESHERYLKKVGFRHVGAGLYERSL